MAESYRGTDNLCVTMFGDGAARQGALYESFNMAMTWKIPVLYIVENNQYAMGTSVERTSNVTDLFKIGSAFDMPSEPVDGMDPEAVHDAIEKAAKHIEKIEDAIHTEIDAAVKFADESDLPLASELYDNNYVQEDYPFITD